MVCPPPGTTSLVSHSAAASMRAGLAPAPARCGQAARPRTGARPATAPVTGGAPLGKGGARRHEFVGALPVGGGGVHGEDVQQQARAGRYAEAANSHVVQRLAHHERRDAVQPLRLLGTRGRTWAERGRRCAPVSRACMAGCQALRVRAPVRPRTQQRCGPVRSPETASAPRRKTCARQALSAANSAAWPAGAAARGQRPRETHGRQRWLLSPRPTWLTVATSGMRCPPSACTTGRVQRARAWPRRVDAAAQPRSTTPP
jgi:hypothetical protein